MRSRRNREVVLPEWLWFFVALPLGMIALLLYRRREVVMNRLGARLPGRLARPTSQPRYSEPDSIPLEIRHESIREELAGEEIGIDDEDSAAAKAQAGAGEAERTISFKYDTESEAQKNVEPEAQKNIEPETQTPPASTGEADDLKIIEGIGPAIAGLLRTQGIITFRQLANTPADRLVEILTEARLNRLANPETWPEQARLAADGKWGELEQLKGTLKAGRRAKNE